MPWGLIRLHHSQQLHFITFSCYRRQPFLKADHAKAVFEHSLEQIRRSYRFHVKGYVVMPEHVHLLVTEPERSTLASAIQALKQSVAQKLAGHHGRFWQTRYYDFNVCSLEKRVEKLKYIHRNPVRRGLAATAADWPWSSYRHLPEVCPWRSLDPSIAEKKLESPMKKLIFTVALVLFAVFGSSTLRAVSCQGPQSGKDINPECACGQPPCNCSAYDGAFNLYHGFAAADPTYDEHIFGNHSFADSSFNYCVYAPGTGDCSSSANINWSEAAGSETGVTAIIDGLQSGHFITANSQNAGSDFGAPGAWTTAKSYAAAVVATAYGGCVSCFPLMTFGSVNNGIGSPPTVQLVAGDWWYTWSSLDPSTESCPPAYAQATPLVLDLDGLGFKDAFTDKAGGVQFDILSIGYKAQTSWSNRGRNIGFLVARRASDAITPLPPVEGWNVASGKELFGGVTNQRAPFVEGGPVLKPGEKFESNGFNALHVFDLPQYGGNGDGKIDEHDKAYTEWLRVWVDTAHDGISSHGKLYTLADLGIKSISTTYTVCKENCTDQNGNNLRFVGHVEMKDPHAVPVEAVDVIFNYSFAPLTEKQKYKDYPPILPPKPTH